ncbi:MAG TPA: glycosyltransferase [Candidatus Dormibacteraeota bacterium]
MTSLPFFSVVMPTYQRRESLRRTLDTLARVQYPCDRFELVLVSDGSTDGSVEMARSLSLPFRVNVLDQPNQGPAAARNLALTHARGPFVLFLDDDVLASPGLIAEHARAHVEAPSDDRVVIGTLLPPDTLRSPWVQWELDTVVKQYVAMAEGLYAPTPRQFYTGNASVRLERVRAAGGFDAGFKRAEDVELAFRLERMGLAFVFRPSASAVHMAERSLRSWIDAAHQYGRNDVVLGLRRGRPDMLAAIAREFWERNAATRLLVRAGLRAKGAERVLARPAAAAAWVALRLRRRRLSHAICSALFNLAYWRGVGDELGAPASARRLIRQAAPS